LLLSLELEILQVGFFNFFFKNAMYFCNVIIDKKFPKLLVSWWVIIAKIFDDIHLMKM